MSNSKRHGSKIVPLVNVESCASPESACEVEAKLLAGLGMLLMFPEASTTPPVKPRFELVLLNVPEPLAWQLMV
jgi:hypothetical protein